MVTNDNDSAVYDYDDDGNDAHHAPLCAHRLEERRDRGPPPWRAGGRSGEPERLGNRRQRCLIMMMINMMMTMLMVIEYDGFLYKKVKIACAKQVCNYIMCADK